MIPQHLHVQGMVFSKIRELTDSKPNDTDLGKELRLIINDYKEGKYNPPSTIELDVNVRKSEVLMLPTKNGIFSKRLEDDKLVMYSTSSDEKFDAQHLYFLSNEGITVGDWFWDGRGIRHCDNRTVLLTYYQKIIATTDCLESKEEIDGKMWYVDSGLPQPNESFIIKFAERYNEDYPIELAMLECELDGSLKLNPGNTLTILKPF